MSQSSDKNEITQRLKNLKREFVSPELIASIYGLELTEDSALGKRFAAWAGRHYRRDSVVFDEEKIHRWRLETYLQREQLVPVKWAAVQQGMSESSFREVTTKLVASHLLDWEPQDSQVIRESDLKGIRDNFEDLRWRTFKDIQDFCSRLHRAIEAEFGLEVDALYCITSKFLDEDNPLYAQAFDALTDQPISTVYEHWLKTGKPMHLRPDTCATLTLIQHEELLGDLLFTDANTKIMDPVRERISAEERRP